MNNVSSATENIFRLLVPATDLTPPDKPSVELCGSRWVLTEWMPIADAPPYTCISYSWGSGKVKNMLENGQLMSYRTIPVIEATLKASRIPEHWTYALMRSPRNEQKEAAAVDAAINATQAIWIDALCLPTREPAQSACLRSLGAIYSSAAQVFAVLSESCAKLLQKFHTKEHMNPEELFVLENDDWLSRVWTLVEMGKSKKALFIAQGNDSSLSLTLDFLNTILTDTADYADDLKIKRDRLSAHFPRLENLQQTIAGHQLAEFTGISAYQVMSAMQLGNIARKLDRIYAMIAAITDLPSDNPDDATVHPAEYFMQVCEAKGDYSFIFCTAPRSAHQGKRWRPVADQMQPVLSELLASGSGLTGCIKETHLQLHNMCRMNPGRLNTVTKSIGNFLQVNIPVSILEQLRQKGFTGCGEYLELESGYFFPQSSFTRSKDLFVVASEDVIWAQGAPGMLLRSNGTDINQFCDVGVFIGRLPKGGESINVG